MADTVRAFLAFEIPEPVKDEIASSRELLRSCLPRARWVRPASQHLTVKFLGEVERARITALASDLGPALDGLGRASSRSWLSSNGSPRRTDSPGNVVPGRCTSPKPG